MESFGGITRLWRCLAITIFVFCAPVTGLADETESLCAVVKIQIEQEATFERQGFEATLDISNTLEDIPLENVQVDLDFTDKDGNEVEVTNDDTNESAYFFKQDPELTNLSSVDGTGSIPAKSEAEAKWLIVPSQNAAQGADGSLYFAGATLSYTYGGKEETVDIAPDNIVVKPQPNLVLDYFLTREIHGDHPLTTQTEPVEPYELGLRVLNNGDGAAPDFAIDTAQPEIVENEQGLAIDFEILKGFVNDKIAQPSLRLDFGTVEGQSATTGHWIMETSLEGTFVDMSADFQHAAHLGGSLTSLLDQVNIHSLVHRVRMPGDNEDGVTDFLVKQDDSFKVFDSALTGRSAPGCLHCFTVQSIFAESSEKISLSEEKQGVEGVWRELHLEDGAAGDSPMYARVPDPYSGNRYIARAVAWKDGEASELDLNNVWTFKRTRESGEISSGTDDPYKHYLNVFHDGNFDRVDIYVRQEEDTNLPPQFQAVANQTVSAGDAVGFLVQAGDPEGDRVEITAEQVPGGASFTPMDAGGFAFNWQTDPGQSGNYQAVFSATDGVNTSRMVVPIKVQGDAYSDPSGDADGDGMPNGYEQAHGLDPLDPNDADLDSDGDGFTNLEEYKAGSDPTDAQSTPLTVAKLLHTSELGASRSVVDVAVSPDGAFVYTVEGKRIAVYRRDPATGMLSDRRSYAAGGWGDHNSDIELGPDGEYLVFARGMIVYRVDQRTGALQKVQRLGGDSGQPTFSADGDFLYAPVTGDLSVYQRTASGRFERIDRLQASELGGYDVNSFESVALSKDGETLFWGADNVVALSRDPATGKVSAPILAGYGNPYRQPKAMLVHPDTGDVYAATKRLERLAWEGTDGSESLTKVSANAGGHEDVALGPQNRLLYTVDKGSDRLVISRYDAGSDEVTTVERMRPFETDAAGTSLSAIERPMGVAVTGDGRHVYLASKGSNSVVQFRHDRFNDLDGDGVANDQDNDIDGDGEPNDTDAFPYDPDETTDSDGDGWGDNEDAFPNDASAFRDTDGDGVADSQDSDDDGDGMPDSWEIEQGLDSRDASDASIDEDDDGLTHLEEYNAGTDPFNADTDGDGGLDGDELDQGTDPTYAEADIDSDGDGCINSWEMEYGFKVYNDGEASPGSADDDGDGLTNMEECQAGTDPFTTDTDGDGVDDATEVNSHGTDPTISAYRLLHTSELSASKALSDVTVSPDGDFVYTLEGKQGDTEVAVYRRDPDTGALSGRRAYSAGWGGHTGRLQFSPNGEYLVLSAGIYVYRVDQRTGALNEVQRLGGEGHAPVFGPNGDYLYVPVNLEKLYTYKQTASGRFEQIDVLSRTELDTASYDLDYLRSIAVSDDGETLFWGSGDVVALSRDPSTGLIGRNVIAAHQASNINPKRMLMHPDTGDLYLARRGGRLARVGWDDTDGNEALTLASRNGGGQDDMELGPNHALFYNVHGQDHELAVNRYNAGDDEVVHVETLRKSNPDAAGADLSSMSSPNGVAVSPDGRHVYAAAEWTNTVVQFRHDRFNDLDGDGVANDQDNDIDGDGEPNDTDAFPYDPDETTDSDGDGWGDNEDAFPNDASAFRDTDGDGVADSQDSDDDGDGMPDSWEIDQGLDPRDASDASIDEDDDGLTHLEEYNAGTDPFDADTDGDGTDDGTEVEQGTDPLQP